MPSPSETLLCQYRYDPLDRLVANALPNEPERQRFYCKSRLATETHGAIGYSIVQHEDQLLAQRCSEGDSSSTALLVTDQQSSVLQTFDARKPRQPFAYSPYGHRLTTNGISSAPGFNGERSDPVTGWYLLGNGYRPFNPALMRFICPDNLCPFGKGGLNAYVYCGGDPANRTDTNGHWYTTFIKRITDIASNMPTPSDSAKVIKALDREINKFPPSTKEYGPWNVPVFEKRLFDSAFIYKMEKTTKTMDEIKKTYSQPEPLINVEKIERLKAKLSKQLSSAQRIADYSAISDHSLLKQTAASFQAQTNGIINSLDQTFAPAYSHFAPPPYQSLSPNSNSLNKTGNIRDPFKPD